MHAAAGRDLQRLRRLLAVILAVGMVGVAAELLLLGHTEAWQQRIPLGLLALGLAALVASTLNPRLEPDAAGLHRSLAMRISSSSGPVAQRKNDSRDARSRPDLSGAPRQLGDGSPDGDTATATAAERSGAGRDQWID